MVPSLVDKLDLHMHARGLFEDQLLELDDYRVARIGSETMQRLALLGCGHIGKPLLRGVLHATRNSPRAPSFNVSVPKASSAQQLRDEFAEYRDRVQFTCNSNIQVAKNSDVVLLCFPPSIARQALTQPGLAESMNGKLIISLLAGVSHSQISRYLSGSFDEADRESLRDSSNHIVQVMPTLGNRIHMSATLIMQKDPPVPEGMMDFTRNLFKHIGETYYAPEHLYDSVTGLQAVSHALMTVAIDALIDGAAVAGIPGKYVETMSMHVFRGHASMVQQGNGNETLKKSLLTPSGLTVASMVCLERKGLRTAITDAVMNAVRLNQRYKED